MLAKLVGFNGHGRKDGKQARISENKISAAKRTDGRLT